uniref:Uncharacterized protein n=1 Tax=Timema poppense TaxID=170557 RepID=A0A7R9CUH7_TIMPO|nr:unnamed protein product [Timema poppensis]
MKCTNRNLRRVSSDDNLVVSADKKSPFRDGKYSSPMASLVLTDRFEKLPDQIMYPYAEPYALQTHKSPFRDGKYSSPMASLVLTDRFEKLPDQIMYPYAEPYALQTHTSTRRNVSSNQAQISHKANLGHGQGRRPEIGKMNKERGYSFGELSFSNCTRIVRRNVR